MERIPDISRSVPRRAAGVEASEKDGRVTLAKLRLGPVRRRVLRLFGIPPKLTVHLDAVGSEAWRLIDGRRTAGDIRVALQAAFPEEAQMGARLGKFLGLMVSRGLVELG